MKTAIPLRRALLPLLLTLGYHARAQAPAGVGIGTTQPVSRLSLGTAGSAGNNALGRIANFEDSNGLFFYGTGLARNASFYGLGLWGGTGSSLPWNGTGGQLPHLFLESSGRVGIGTLTPDRLLTLQAPASGDLLSFRSSGGSTLWHWTLTGGGVNLAETGVADGRFYIAPGGNVGLGTLNPQARLHVAGGLRVDGLAGTGTRMLTVDLNGTLGAAGLPVNTDAQTLSLGSSGTQRTLAITGGNSVTLDVADNDNSPTNELQTISKAGATVMLSNGGGSFTDSDNQSLSFNNNSLSLTNGGSADLSSLRDNLGSHTATQTLRLNGNWLSGDGDPQGLAVDGDGRVGVGTGTPHRLLYVRGNGPVLALEGSDHSYLEFYPQGYTSGRKAYLGTPSGGSSNLHLANEEINGHISLLPGGGAGRVGVGTDAPFSRLSLGTAGSAGNDALSRVANYEAADGSYFYGTGLADNGNFFGLGLWGGTGSGQPYNGSTGQPAHVFVQSNGQVGIGTTTPQAQLHVAGSALVDAQGGSVRINQTGYSGFTTSTELSTLEAVLTGSATLPNIGSSQWQEFVVPRTGRITAVTIRFYASGASSPSINFYRYVNGSLVGIGAGSMFGTRYGWQNLTSTVSVDVQQGEVLRLQVRNGTNSGANWAWATNQSNPVPNGASSAGGNDDFFFSIDMRYTTGSVDVPIFSAVNGNVGIGYATPDINSRLDVNGAIRCVSLTQASDARFKRDVRPIGEALAKVQALRGVRYYWRQQEFPQRQFTDDEQLGFLAQEIEQVLPQAVQKDAQGYYSVDYQKVVPVLTEAIKELQAKLAASGQKLEQAAADNAALRQQVAADRRRAEASAAGIEARLRALEAGTASQARR